MTDSQEQPQFENGPGAGLPHRDLGRYVTSLANSVSKGMMDELELYGLTPLEYSLMRFCRERTECTATELAEVLPLDVSRISRMVTRLVDRGFLARRRPREDRRVVYLRLSDEGQELTSYLIQHLQVFYDRLTENISDAEMGVFLAVTLKINENYEAWRPSL